MCFAMKLSPHAEITMSPLYIVSGRSGLQATTQFNLQPGKNNSWSFEVFLEEEQKCWIDQQFTLALQYFWGTPLWFVFVDWRTCKLQHFPANKFGSIMRIIWLENPPTKPKSKYLLQKPFWLIEQNRPFVTITQFHRICIFITKWMSTDLISTEIGVPISTSS